MTDKNKGGWNSAPDYTPQGGFWRDQLIVVALLLSGVIMGFVLSGRAKADVVVTSTKIAKIYWSDADSGKLNGKVDFRLANVDAPETGGVGAAIGGAKCERERDRGFDAKEWAVTFTRGVELSIAKEYGLDKYNRLVLDLSAAGVDVGGAGVEAGHLKPWPHKHGRAMVKKPDWC